MNQQRNNELQGVRIPDVHAPEPIQLVSLQLIDAYWPSMEQHFAEVVRRHSVTEYSASDIYTLATTGQCVLIAVANDKTGLNPDREVYLSLAIEVVQYPKKAGINILAIGGTNLSVHQRKFWEQFKGWAYMNGARFIEASVTSGMQRMLQRLGFVEIHRTVRLDLSE